MSAGVSRLTLKSGAVVLALMLCGATVEIVAQGGRGRGGPPPPPGRPGAPVDLTGTWVSVVTEDWQWRMRTPAKGDTTSVPLNPQGVKVANSWEPSMDGRCEAFGVGGIMRMPLRLKISWQDDLTLKIETDAGQQTRLLQFAKPGAGAAAPVSGAPPSARTFQGTSVAEWQRSGGAFDAFLERGAGAAPPRWGALKVTTTNVLPGWLRRNGVPYSQDRVLQQGDAPAGRRMVRRDDGRRRSDVPGAAIRDQLELQERGE
jgi:hypothetical protein